MTDIARCPYDMGINVTYNMCHMVPIYMSKMTNSLYYIEIAFGLKVESKVTKTWKIDLKSIQSHMIHQMVI